jgi:heptosyltransferase II
MKILVRLPNWLGDMVMSVGFISQLPHFFPGAEVSFVVKKGIHELLPLFPEHKHHFVFDKNEYKGLNGLRKFGKEIRSREKFDLFFCLPDSFSSAFMAFNSGAKKTIGYKKEFRQILLTHSYKKPKGLHRAEEYIKLLEMFTGKPAGIPSVVIPHNYPRQDHIVVNINSEASSRRLTLAKATELIDVLKDQTSNKIIMIGAPKESGFIEEVLNKTGKEGIENLAGKTTLMQLGEVLASSRLLLSTDSGPAHLANALGTPTIVLFGAGKEETTSPYRKDLCTTIRLGQLPCEPCEKNICLVYGIPQCLERLDSMRIVQKVKMYLP